jgi:[protein-PII] uridylyltransferase
MAALLHDIAKGRGGDHSELGARIAQEVCPRLGLSPEETETVSWLVLHHLLISQSAFKRDIEDPKTILDIADLVQSPERLRLLLVLTVADMRAVGPKVWNGWKATLLREVYWRVAEVLAGGLSVPERDVRVARARDAAGGAARGLAGGGAGAASSASATPATGCPSTPRPTPATRRWCGRRRRPRRR